MKIEDFFFGALDSPSGNSCSVQMRIEKAQRVTIEFSWENTPGPDDVEEWGFTMLGMALERALQEALRYRGGIEALRGLEADGEFERFAVAEDGDWLYRSISKGRGATKDGAVVSLAV